MESKKQIRLLLAANVFWIVAFIFVLTQERGPDSEFAEKFKEGGVVLTTTATVNDGQSYLVRLGLAPDAEKGIRIVGMELHPVRKTNAEQNEDTVQPLQ